MKGSLIFLTKNRCSYATLLCSKALVLVAAICMNLIFIYYSADLTATMTSQPPAVRIKSFQDVEDQGYKVVSRGAGRLAHTNLKNAPEGSAMQRLYGSDRQGFPLLI